MRPTAFYPRLAATGTSMSIQGRVSKLERRLAAANRTCKLCAGIGFGVTFADPPRKGHDFHGHPPPPAACPRCGRIMAKQYVLPDIGAWEAI